MANILSMGVMASPGIVSTLICAEEHWRHGSGQLPNLKFWLSEIVGKSCPKMVI